jgi:hypothetical protein
MSKTATDIQADAVDAHRDERILHSRMEWFTKKYQPADRREASEFQADLLMLVQAVHQDASRYTHKLLENALRAMPPFTGSFVVDKPK